MEETKEVLEQQEAPVEAVKEEVAAEVLQTELNEEEREAFIEDWNARNQGVGEIRKEKPTEEEVKAIAEEYGARLKEFNETTFEIADKENAVRVAQFLKRWNEEDVQWESNMWQGTITFDMIIKKFLEDCKDEPKPLIVNYQTLVYLFLGLRNIKGVGLKSAIHMQKINDEFVPILDTVGDQLTEYQEEGKKLQQLQERWRMFEQGFYVTFFEQEQQPAVAQPVEVEEPAEEAEATDEA